MRCVVCVQHGEGRELGGRRDGQENGHSFLHGGTQTSGDVLTIWTNCSQKMKYMGI